MKVRFLGTGTSQGVPVIGSDHPVCLSNDEKDKRLRSSVLIEIEETILVIDCGPDFRQQMLRANPSHINGILFTHEHADHTAGLDDIRPFYFKQGNIHIYVHERVEKSLKERFAYIFDEKNRYPGAPEVSIHNIANNQTFKVNGVTITPVEALHYKLPVFGFKVLDFVYLTDVKTMADEEIAKIKNIKVLVINALREKDHISHLTLSEALALIEKVQPERAYLTHISHLLGFHEEVSKKLPKNVFLAYDNLELQIP